MSAGEMEWEGEWDGAVHEDDDGDLWINGEQVQEIDDDGTYWTESGAYVPPQYVEDDEPSEYLADDYQPPMSASDVEEDYRERVAGVVPDVLSLQRNMERRLTDHELAAVDYEMRRQHEAGAEVDANQAFWNASSNGGIRDVDMDDGDSRREYLEERGRDLNAKPQALSGDELASAERFLAHDGTASHDDREAFFAARLEGRLQPTDDGEYQYQAEEE